MKDNPNLVVLLESVVLMQMLMENLEELQNSKYNRHLLKQQIKKTLEVITPIAERDYNIVFNNSEQTTQSIVFEYAKLVKFIAANKLPHKVSISQFIEAFNLDSDTIEATCHRIIKKHSK